MCSDYRLCTELVGVEKRWSRPLLPSLSRKGAPDVASYHNRSIVILPPRDSSRWLDPTHPAHDLLTPLPAGSLAVEQA